jgi:hypothetical protein
MLKLYGGETVEKIATGRRGKVEAFGTVGAQPSILDVKFFDGKQPYIERITDVNEWRLIVPPDDDGPPGFRPENWVV